MLTVSESLGSTPTGPPGPPMYPRASGIVKRHRIQAKKHAKNKFCPEDSRRDSSPPVKKTRQRSKSSSTRKNGVTFKSRGGISRITIYICMPPCTTATRTTGRTYFFPFDFFLCTFDFIEVVIVQRLTQPQGGICQSGTKAKPCKNAEHNDIFWIVWRTQGEACIQLDGGWHHVFRKVMPLVLQQLFGGKASVPALDQGHGTFGLEAIQSTACGTHGKATNQDQKVEWLAILQEGDDGKHVEERLRQHTQGRFGECPPRSAKVCGWLPATTCATIAEARRPWVLATLTFGRVQPCILYSCATFTICRIFSCASPQLHQLQLLQANSVSSLQSVLTSSCFNKRWKEALLPWCTLWACFESESKRRRCNRKDLIFHGSFCFKNFWVL